MTPAASRGGFIHSAPFDAVLLIGCPLLSFALGWACSLLPAQADQISFMGQPATLTGMALKAIIHAHLVIVFFRSHGNATVRARHPWRFGLVPVLLVVTTTLWEPVLIWAIVVSTYWDNIHSSLQTFGIGRIYDMKAGADVTKGRQLDLWLNMLLYWAPFMAGPIWGMLIWTFRRMGFAADHGLIRLLEISQPVCQRVLWVAAPTLLAMYAWHTWQRWRAGEILSWQKYALFLSTGITSVWAWGFNPFGQALLIVNVFHAVQYFAIVWWSEKKNLATVLGLGTGAAGARSAAAVLVVVGGLYGFWIASASDFWAHGHPWTMRVVLAVTNSVALLHFWYDGFIWSVRNKHV